MSPRVNINSLDVHVLCKTCLTLSLGAECFLRGVDDVEKAVLVLVSSVDLRDGARVAGHAVVVDEEEERLAWMQLQTTSETHQSNANINNLTINTKVQTLILYNTQIQYKLLSWKNHQGNPNLMVLENNGSRQYLAHLEIPSHQQVD